MSLGVLVTVKEPAKASARSSRPLRNNCFFFFFSSFILSFLWWKVNEKLMLPVEMEKESDVDQENSVICLMSDL